MNLLSTYLLGRLARGYLGMVVAIGGLVWVTTVLELLGDADASRSGLETAWAAALQVPVNLIDLLPVIAVLATATVLTAMQAQREMTVMRASGVSIGRIARIALLPGLLVAMAALVALQTLAPVLYRAPERVAAGGVGETSLWHPWHGLWVRSESRVMNVGRFETGQFPGDITIYEFGEDETLIRQIRAESAVAGPETWLLENVTIKTLEGGADSTERIRSLEQLRWPSFLTERQLQLFRRPPASLPLSDLWTYVHGLKRRGQDASEFELVLWRRIALPLACIAMVLVAAALSLRPMKNRAVGVKVTAAIGVGLGYQLLTGMAGFFGLVTDLPPVLVTMLPPFLLAALSIALLARLR
ncbi:MAG: LPS export ABC transporter permease LptG [Wenzhouxiangellaceae bacterium]|nr:LPS export ABC transporter permease LptG [Wenzhouxiangellaceae bacterium]